MKKPKMDVIYFGDDKEEDGFVKGWEEAESAYDKFLPDEEEIYQILLGNDTPKMRAKALAKRIGKE